MPLYRFVHAADLHLDAPFRGLARREPDFAQRLRDASLQALDNLVDAAIEHDSQFVVVSGDIYDGLHRGVRAQIRLRQAAERLDDHGIRLFLLHGNHDPIDEGYVAVDAWPDNTVIMGPEPEVHRFGTDAGPVTVTGQSYPDRQVRQSLARGYPPPEGEGLHVAMLHTELDEHGLDHPYSPCELGDLVATGFHYWALGHVHDRKVLHTRPPVVAYPGNLQGRHFGECGPRGALFVSGSPHELRVSPLDIAPITFHRVPLDVTDAGPVDGLVRALVDGIPTGAGLRLLRAELTGRSVHHRAIEAQPLDEWLRILQDASPPDARWVDVRREVGPAVDLEALADSPSLAGALVRRAGEGLDVAEILHGFPELRELAARLSPEQRDRLLARALGRVVGEVGGA